MDDNEQKDIDAAIEAASAEAEETPAATDADAPATDAGAETPATDDAPEDGGDGGKGGDAPEDGAKFSPDDALVERAVKAGLSLADARSFTSKDSMERILAALEATASAPKEKGKDAPGDGVSAGDGEGKGGNPLDEIPELSEDEGYDEGLVAAFNGLRRLAIQQSETIRKLAEAGNAAKAADRFTKLCDTLDESVRNGMDETARATLKKQFDILSAGYKATNTEKKDADIFAEAAKLALGDRIAESAAAKRAEALEKRKSLALAKPGGEGGAGRKTGAGYDDDPAAAAAAEIRKELGL